jgi:TRAP-type C4-dicarboxylate transport system permease small subunit
VRLLQRAFTFGTEFIAAALLAAMFVTFLLQVFSRYVLAQPFGWTLELCLALWIWIVFWGNAFIVRERDHVRFDILYLAVPRGWRRVFALISAAAIAIAMIVAWLPTWDYIDFLRIKRSATLRVPMRTIFAIYALFMAVVALRYAWRFWVVARHGAPEDREAAEAGLKG